MQAKYDRLPEHMKHGAKLYIEKGIAPGGFLTAVLENNLKEAVTRADDTNFECIYDWVMWVIWDIPALAHGSKDAVDNWIKQGGMEGVQREYNGRGIA